jgi:Na+-transporting methylmalonyl-CoA/oxaloacetate decarboxylase beta subunit
MRGKKCKDEDRTLNNQHERRSAMFESVAFDIVALVVAAILLFAGITLIGRITTDKKEK